MTALEVIEQLITLLNTPRTEDTCECDRCLATITKFGPHTCETCGYHGLLVAIACQCYDWSCGGSGMNGAGCPHGSLSCPICGEGENDLTAWQLMQELRTALQEMRGQA